MRATKCSFVVNNMCNKCYYSFVLREPMKSWLMTFWLANHDKSEWPDLSICQSEDACHVTDTRTHPSKDVIEKMCSDEFFAKHKYKYVEETFGATGGEEYDYYYCPRILIEGRNSDANENLDQSPMYLDAYSSHMPVEKDQTSLEVKQVPKKPDDNEAGYLCPVTIEDYDFSDMEHSSFYHNTTEVAGCKRSHIKICQAEVGSRTANEAVYSKVSKVKKNVVEYSNGAFTSDEASWDDDTDSIVTYDTPGVAYQNLAYVWAEGHSFQDEDAGHTLKHETCPEKYQSTCMVCTSSNGNVLMEEDTLACSYGNAAYFTCVSPAEARQSDSEQLVPQSDHLYANVQKKAERVSQDTVPQSGMETEQSHIEDDYQEREALPQSKAEPSDSLGSDGVGEEKLNSTLQSWLDDPQLEIVFYI